MLNKPGKDIASSGQARRPEETARTSGTDQAAPKAASPASPLEFNLADIEKRLAETRREAGTGKYQVAMAEKYEEVDERPAIVPAPVKPAPAVAPPPQEAIGESGLLAGLALEAKESLGAKQSADADRQARERRVHDALTAIVKYFTVFNKHVNAVEPQINRTYSLDARAVFSNLKWRRATIDFRKQSLSDTALFDHAIFSVYLCTPEPVVIKRPWSQYEATKKEIRHLMLDTLDDLDEIGKRPKQEWLEARFTPDFLVQLKFNGNYELGCVDVAGRNIETFGAVNFRLKPEDVTPKMLDELGLYLLARSNKLPAALQQV